MTTLILQRGEETRRMVRAMAIRIEQMMECEPSVCTEWLEGVTELIREVGGMDVQYTLCTAYWRVDSVRIKHSFSS